MIYCGVTTAWRGCLLADVCMSWSDVAVLCRATLHATILWRVRRGKSENHAKEHVYAVLQVAKSFHHCDAGQPCTHGVTISSFTSHGHYDGERYPNSTVFRQKVALLLWRVFLSRRVEGCGMASCFSRHGEMDSSHFAFSLFCVCCRWPSTNQFLERGACCALRYGHR